MRRLLPAPPLDDVDPDEAYAVPTAGRHVRANMVASADGGAQADGVTEGLSGVADKRLFSVLRGLTDVILVGAGTVRAEDYGPARPTDGRRAWRREHGLAEVPPIAVVSGDLRLDPASRFFVNAVARPIVLTHAAAPPDRRSALSEVADVVPVGDQTVDLALALAELERRGLRHVLCEGGPRLLAQLVSAGLLDEFCLTVAPLFVSGGAIRVLDGPPLPAPARAELQHVLEDDDGFLFLRYRLVPG